MQILQRGLTYIFDLPDSLLLDNYPHFSALWHFGLLSINSFLLHWNDGTSKQAAFGVCVCVCLFAAETLSLDSVLFFFLHCFISSVSHLEADTSVQLLHT